MKESAKKQRIIISLRDVSRGFREGELTHTVLSNLSINVLQGESVALRGRSGSGKSTLLNLISGIDEPDSGEIFVDGTCVSHATERDRTLFRRQHIGFVYQAFNLVPTLTVADNVRLVLELNKVAEPQASERVGALLDAVGLADRAASYPDILSGGEQQRVAIARALVHEPSLILADEPTGNLDDQAARVVLELLDRLVAKVGGTMIIATHSSTVAATCDRVLELHDGIVTDYQPNNEQGA